MYDGIVHLAHRRFRKLNVDLIRLSTAIVLSQESQIQRFSSLIRIDQRNNQKTGQKDSIENALSVEGSMGRDKVLLVDDVERLETPYNNVLKNCFVLV